MRAGESFAGWQAGRPRKNSLNDLSARSFQSRFGMQLFPQSCPTEPRESSSGPGRGFSSLLDPSHTVRHQRNDKQHQKNEEANPCDASRCNRDSAESKDGRHQRNHKES
jgi:hypothetical protein